MYNIRKIEVLCEVLRMLFRKEIEPCCAYCTYAGELGDASVVCVKRGVSNRWDQCRHFKYDPLKRVPDAPQMLKNPGLREADFEL